MYDGAGKKSHAQKPFAQSSNDENVSSQVIVKIAGFAKNAAQIKSHLDYITRKGEVGLELDTGEFLESKIDIQDYFDELNEKIKSEKQLRKVLRETLHLVLSAPSYVDANAVERASRRFARQAFRNHEYAFALHTDTDNSHCHLIVRLLDHDGKKFQQKIAHIQQWRKIFAEQVNELGFELEATTRYSRGITARPDKYARKRKTLENPCEKLQSEELSERTEAQTGYPESFIQEGSGSAPNIKTNKTIKASKAELHDEAEDTLFGHTSEMGAETLLLKTQKSSRSGLASEFLRQENKKKDIQSPDLACETSIISLDRGKGREREPGIG